MPTARAYIEGAAAYCVWMVLYMYLQAAVVTILNFADGLGGDFVAGPVDWMRLIIEFWPLLGLVGIFVALMAAGISARDGGIPQMALVKRSVVIAIWMTVIALYLAVIGGSLPTMFDLARDFGAEESDFWWLLQDVKYLTTHLIPAVLIAGPIVTWVYGVIREEASRQPTQVRPR